MADTSNGNGEIPEIELIIKVSLRLINTFLVVILLGRGEHRFQLVAADAQPVFPQKCLISGTRCNTQTAPTKTSEDFLIFVVFSFPSRKP